MMSVFLLNVMISARNQKLSKLEMVRNGESCAKVMSCMSDIR